MERGTSFVEFMYLVKNSPIFLEVVFFVRTLLVINLGSLLIINSGRSFSWASSFYFTITAKR